MMVLPMQAIFHARQEVDGLDRFCVFGTIRLDAIQTGFPLVA
jgi:hypothetical protein